MRDDIIKLDGASYDAASGRKLNDATSAKAAQAKRAARSNTLNRDFVKKPSNLKSNLNPVTDNRAQKPQIHRFHHDIIIPSKDGPKAPKISHFHRGDTNNTDKPIILDIKPRHDVIVTREQNQKLIEAIERAKQIDLERRAYASQMSRQRRKHLEKVRQTINRLNQDAELKESLGTQKPKTSTADDEKNLKARRDQIINQAIATAPSNTSLSKNKVKNFNDKNFFHKHSFGLLTVLAGLLMTGLLVYLGWNNIMFNFARSSLALDTIMPSNTPINYQMEEAPKIANKTLILTYKNDRGERIIIQETKSKLDSQSVLIKNVIPQVGENYQIHRQNGLTIYLYGDGEAIWSNGGILYYIEAKALSESEIQQLATSL